MIVLTRTGGAKLAIHAGNIDRLVEHTAGGTQVFMGGGVFSSAASSGELVYPVCESIQEILEMVESEIRKQDRSF